MSRQLTIVLFAALLLAVLVDAAVVVPAVGAGPALAAIEEFDPRPQYKYGYDVDDALSGDNKGHIEERDGDVVRGEYSLIDPDGFKRIVTYTADSVNGFNAVVRREPIIVAPAVAPVAPVAATPVVEPLIKAAPLLAAPAPVPVAALRSAPLVRPVAPGFAFRRL